MISSIRVCTARLPRARYFCSLCAPQHLLFTCLPGSPCMQMLTLQQLRMLDNVRQSPAYRCRRWSCASEWHRQARALASRRNSSQEAEAASAWPGTPLLCMHTQSPSLSALHAHNAQHQAQDLQPWASAAAGIMADQSLTGCGCHPLDCSPACTAPAGL